MGLWLGFAVCCSNTDFKVGKPSGDASAGSAGQGGGAGSAGQGGSAGAAGAGAGGQAGDAGTDASAGTAGTAGTAGQPGCSSPCAGGDYCNVASGRCTPCSDVSRFRFAAARPIAVGGTASRRFPRATEADGQLLFRIGDQVGPQTLHFTASFADNTAPEAFGTDVNVSGEATSGPLFIDTGNETTTNFYF
ncbi:MAG TPA: hypothetical protein VK524_29130, partial [Polyangiaceae bacterium]|nr:hypothetical protein [Polyangiaceae bacterium]